MKSFIIALAAVFAFAGSCAFAHGYKRHHHYHHYRHDMSRSVGGANGTAGGSTSLSGTGSSKFGGNVPGATGHY
ncbi:MAG: hypothetical protein KGL35_07860 [Bradyrhizobium sp.]|uniref:hypothetical protein n=1 Tax=Bradyrhizobium sp. TaxID=376 RepID=UPI001C2966E1|nr:hypothetical protein [Bradyrhizobium sp.]MBU6465024.1 hypothetical protein [Pseudomonadota bacterium]MDE2066957.1 hypothetical protein [Bradyrhizobium sp.]MDE2468644.1 hypothetical protein [Bradyrhizobium sp.]